MNTRSEIRKVRALAVQRRMHRDAVSVQLAKKRKVHNDTYLIYPHKTDFAACACPLIHAHRLDVGGVCVLFAKSETPNYPGSNQNLGKPNSGPRRRLFDSG